MTDIEIACELHGGHPILILGRQSQAVSEALSIIFGVASEASDSTAWFYCLERSMDVFDLAALHAI